MNVAGRRPYRVVFTTADDPVRQGTIVTDNEITARREAAAVASQGGTAVVVYIRDDGARETVATYLPEYREPDAPT